VKASLTFPLVGLDVEEKADLLVRSLFAAIPGGREAFQSVDVDLVRSDHEDPERNEVAIANLRVTFKDPDEKKLGKPLTAAITELGLASYPGFFGGPSAVQAYGVYWPTTVPSDLLAHEVVVGDESVSVAPTLPTGEELPAEVAAVAVPAPPGGPTRRMPIGRVVGARSGDKGGNANLGVWTRTDEEFGWLSDFLTVERLKALMPETKALAVERFDFPRIRSLNFVIKGLLGEGVASSTRMDPQAKSLGEYLRAKHVDVPVAFAEIDD